MRFDIISAWLCFSTEYPMVFHQRWFFRLSCAGLIFTARHLGSTELREMASLQNIQGPIRDQVMWRTLCPATFQPLPGTKQVVISCESRNLYPISKLSPCIGFVRDVFSFHFLNSLCPILWFMCFWEGSKHFGVTCVDYKHYSKVLYFQAEMGKHSRNWPRLEIKWKKVPIA